MRSAYRIVPPLIAALGLLAGPAAAEPKGVGYEIAAARDAAYRLKCRFPRVRLDNGQPYNSIEFQRTGRRKGRIPADGGVRCTLSKLHGPGPITLILVKDGERTVTVSEPGETAHLQVW